MLFENWSNILNKEDMAYSIGQPITKAKILKIYGEEIPPIIIIYCVHQFPYS